MKRLPVLLAAVCSLAASIAFAQTLYKLVDKNGKVTYSETAPRPGEFDGTVTRIDVNPNANTAQMPRFDKSTPQAAPKAEAGGDYLSERRARRAGLEERVKSAQANLANARAALEKASAEDALFVRGPEFAGSGRPQPGNVNSPTNVQKANCREVKSAKGGTSVVCPHPAVNPEAAAKLEALEDAVKKAQQELVDAEAALARGRE